MVDGDDDDDNNNNGTIALSFHCNRI